MPDPSSPLSISDRTIGAYLESLGSAAPTPGGGSAAAILGALGASLGLMVVALTQPDEDETSAALAGAETTLTRLQHRFTSLADEDEAAYGAYREAAALPKGSPEERAPRRAAMQGALKGAAMVPLRCCEAAVDLSRALGPILTHGNPHVRSDARIAAICARACFDASRVNVEVNLAMIRDEAWNADVACRLDALAAELRRLRRHVDAVGTST